MNMSLNELNSVLKRFFESIGFGRGDYEDAARMVLWLESHGLNGLEEVRQGLPYLDQHQYTPTDVTVSDESWLIVEGKGESVLSCATQAIDLAYTQACQTGTGLVQLDHCHNRKLMIERLANCGRRNDISCIAFWRNGRNTVTEHVVRMNSRQANDEQIEHYPSYRTYTIDHQKPRYNAQSLYILCANDPERLMQQFSHYQHQALADDVLISSQQLASAYDNSLENGITVNTQLLVNLETLAQRILVESTEQSRSGAGGA